MSNVLISSGSNNWGTPKEVIDCVHRVIGFPDLDPCSSQTHNQRVQAKNIITETQDGLAICWSNYGDVLKVFCNPPGGKIGNKSQTLLFWNKLTDNYLSGTISEAIFLAFNLGTLQNSQQFDFSLLDFPCCIPSKRIRFIGEEMKSQPTHGNALAYLGGNAEKFAEVFSELGKVIRPFNS